MGLKAERVPGTQQAHYVVAVVRVTGWSSQLVLQRRRPG